MQRTTLIVVAVGALVLTACTSPEQQAIDELEQFEEQLDAAIDDANPEPSYLDLDPAGENKVEFDNGLTFTFADFARGVSTWADEETPYVGFDVTISNDTGSPVQPDSGVNLWYTHGETGTEADPVVDAANGIGTEGEYTAEYPEFGATIADGDEVTLRFGYELPEDETRFEIRLQPWDIEGAADVYLTGDIPHE